MSEFIALENEKSPTKSVRLSTTGKILIGITGGVALGLTIISAPFVIPALRKFCLPYIPATDQQIKNVLASLTTCKGSLIDLGSGDGRIVLETARKQFTSHGVELNPWLVLYSKLDAYRKGYGRHVKFFRRDLWGFNLAEYDNVVIFGVEQMMLDLEKKIIKECKTDCRIIACRFPLPNMKPLRTVGHGVDAVWTYKIPLS